MPISRRKNAVFCVPSPAGAWVALRLAVYRLSFFHQPWSIFDFVMPGFLGSASTFGERYEQPKLVLFSGVVQSACGMAQSAVGPFYCPADQQLYLDLSFFRELSERFGAPGDFARAYVVAHEVGHHVQTLLGISDEVRAAQARSSQTESNAIQVRMELQADCLAGVWAYHAQRERQVLEPGDIDEALGAAAAIGDDRLQRETQGRVSPESFTHGTSAQRSQWFRNGFESGDPGACNQFLMT